jgi:hypothetical protein
MINLNPTDPNNNINTDPDKKKTQDKQPPPAVEEKKEALQKQDSVKIKDFQKNDTDNIVNADAIKIASPESKTEDQSEDKHPWKIKNLHVAYGLQTVQFSNSDIHIQQPGYGTDVTLHNVEGEQRTSYTYIWGQPRFSPDEPEFNAKVAVEFENRFGLELDVKHNKYTVQKFDQDVLMTGTMNGDPINEVRQFDSYSNLWDVTAGNHQISLLSTYSVPLPSPKGQALTFNTKIGPSVIVSYSHNSLKNPAGDYEEIDRGKIAYAGFGATLQNSIKYNLGRKVGGVTVELSHSLSYLNFTNIPVTNGTANQAMFASQFALTLGKTFDFSKKK